MTSSTYNEPNGETFSAGTRMGLGLDVDFLFSNLLGIELGGIWFFTEGSYENEVGDIKKISSNPLYINLLINFNPSLYVGGGINVSVCSSRDFSVAPGLQLFCGLRSEQFKGEIGCMATTNSKTYKNPWIFGDTRWILTSLIEFYFKFGYMF